MLPQPSVEASRSYSFRIVGSAAEVRCGTDHFPCPRLHARSVSAECCVRRQLELGTRTRDTWRGQSYGCSSASCPMGAIVRIALTAVRGELRDARPPFFHPAPVVDRSGPPVRVEIRDRCPAA